MGFWGASGLYGVKGVGFRGLGFRGLGIQGSELLTRVSPSSPHDVRF